MSFEWRDFRPVPEPRSRRGVATRQRIIEAAADLFAERGIDGVELGEILAAADQHNASAIQYHFGSRSGLIVAVVQPRPEIRGPLEAARLDAIERLLVEGRPATLEDAVEALVRPMFAILGSHPARSWVRVAVQIIRQLPVENRTDTVGGGSRGSSRSSPHGCPRCRSRCGARGSRPYAGGGDVRQPRA